MILSIVFPNYIWKRPVQHWQLWLSRKTQLEIENELLLMKEPNLDCIRLSNADTFIECSTQDYPKLMLKLIN